MRVQFAGTDTLPAMEKWLRTLQTESNDIPEAFQKVYDELVLAQ